jgi:S-adenosylmethionine:tRNA ribosyltransferase-isomerase
MPDIQLKNYHYELPDDRIARFPAEPRDAAKLQVYNAGAITHTQFSKLADFLPEKSFLFFNNTKVIPARLFFQKSTGALIEIFLLEPVSPSPVVSIAMQRTGSCSWKCLIGNKKRWKHDEILTHKIISEGKNFTLQAKIEDAEQDLIHFHWEEAAMTWLEMIQIFGEIPLPPYFKRKPDATDRENYQTVYARREGAVAAPTAGLHFTENVLNRLKVKGINFDFLTLHVSAGTFQPVKDGDVANHQMHTEQMVVSAENLENLCRNLGNIVAVGTTSLRTLESLYWMGLQAMDFFEPGLFFKEPISVFSLNQHTPYRFENQKLPDPLTALEALLRYLQKQKLQTLTGETGIFIVPGYDFKICNALITNYHLPETTLVLLVAAFVGEDWREIYNAALENDYRFLSYGDSSLLFRK